MEMVNRLGAWACVIALLVCPIHWMGSTARAQNLPAFQCPAAPPLDEAQLAAIIEQARASRQDLPPPFDDFRVRVTKDRCLYIYFEDALPETRGSYVAFVIDVFGEIIEAQTGSFLPD